MSIQVILQVPRERIDHRLRCFGSLLENWRITNATALCPQADPFQDFADAALRLRPAARRSPVTQQDRIKAATENAKRCLEYLAELSNGEKREQVTKLVRALNALSRKS
jgi:hypothetical protein